MNVPTFFKTFLLDLQNKGADEPALQGSINIKTISELIPGIIVPCMVCVNSFTPIFAGALDFKMRTVVGITLSLVFTIICVHIIGSKIHTEHYFSPPEYSYQQIERLAAKLLLLALIITLIASAWEIRFWIGNNGPLQGKVIGQDGRAVPAATVDALNLDKKSVTTGATHTDARGIFVLDLRANNGRAAYLSVTQATDCSDLEVLDHDFRSALKENKSATKELRVKIRCP